MGGPFYVLLRWVFSCLNKAHLNSICRRYQTKLLLMAALSLLLTSVTQLTFENAKIDSSILILSNGISPTHEDKSDLQKTNFSNFSNFVRKKKSQEKK